VPHRLGDEQAAVPRIVLPITSRGLALTDRVCWGILGAAMVVAAGLILWLNRGTTFYVDELKLIWVYGSGGFSVEEVLRPYNGHLVATTRLVYNALLEVFGAGYLPFRLLGVSTVLLSAGLFYALVKRRIGAVPALAPTLVILFLGSDRQHVVDPIGFTIIFSVATGLAALLALERRDRRGDIAACALVVVSVATYSIGLAFLVGVAISVLLRGDRRQRAWIFLIPLALYAAWWLGTVGSAGSGGHQVKLSNVLLLPSYILESLAVVTSALVGLDFNFIDPSQRVVDPGPGAVLAVLAVVALVLRIRRGKVPASMWASLGIVLVFWALGALVVSFLRPPYLARYIYMGAVGVLLVATDAARSIRFSRRGLAVLFGVTAVSLATNLALLRDAGGFFRDEWSIPTRAEFTMIELARNHVRPHFDPAYAAPSAAPAHMTPLLYLSIVDRYGSAGFTLPELEQQSEDVREGADQVLVEALDLRLKPSRSGAPAGGCRQVRGNATGGALTFALPRGGAELRARSASPVPIAVGRFATSPSAGLGRLAPNEATTLSIPPDSSPKPWRASLTGARSVEVCALR
jgi:hypothetical protein